MKRNLKSGIFSGSVATGTPEADAQRDGSTNSSFCFVPLDRALMTEPTQHKDEPHSRKTPAWRSEVIVTSIQTPEYFEDAAFHESNEKLAETFVDTGFPVFQGDATMDHDNLLDKWSRIHL